MAMLLGQEGRRQGTTIRSVTQPLQTGYNRTRLGPAGPKMAEDLTSGAFEPYYVLTVLY